MAVASSGMKVSKTFYLEVKDLEAINSYAKKNEVSDSEAFRRFVRAGHEALHARGHDPRRCKICAELGVRVKAR